MKNWWTLEKRLDAFLNVFGAWSMPCMVLYFLIPISGVEKNIFGASGAVLAASLLLTLYSCSIWVFVSSFTKPYGDWGLVESWLVSGLVGGVLGFVLTFLVDLSNATGLHPLYWLLGLLGGSVLMWAGPFMIAYWVIVTANSD